MAYQNKQNDINFDEVINKPINPVLVEFVRGDLVESQHRGSVVVTDASGRIRFSVGDFQSSIFPRSAIKPLQALMLVETGAADTFGLDLSEIALACSSHSGSQKHVEILRKWLNKIGCDETDLTCGPSWPLENIENECIPKSDGLPSRLQDNCSGKHAALLTVAKHLNYPMYGYTRLDHPIQQNLLQLLEQMTDMDLMHAPKTIDGSGVPALAVSPEKFACAMARLVNPDMLTEKRKFAANKIVEAIIKHPFLFAGNKRFETRIIQACQGQVLLKAGSQGVYGAGFPKLGLGVALKIDDGSQKAAEIAMMQVLRIFDVLSERAKGMLLNILEPPIFTRSGEVVGVAKGVGPLTT